MRLVVAALTALTAIVLQASLAAAQTAPPADGATPEPAADPFNAGGVVFFVVCGIILGGALVLYLRHRRPRTHD